ncbi:uncharacterized protein AMSG_08137 [Thecamonas trahens ATCC 50062]|uniref:Dickkopf N-terminal cysteine-rich domain-containing protein n=1 Tax=Thecamonas trahens ATCC 50062 TaxID=461836 RepID=A0A0L0DK51_THETB|nr:hypothetical protein AMSG_08137 [Thecamonas trahens ATCC 50062]KNC52570.1 hypothetical protein AMSG_08137 [Thecamonas trahens ATCC 50062]|eukprot:XP_013755360.1 hypothetical protein AMSG_08137 [Thecamonas trahens ATCC 50062]
MRTLAPSAMFLRAVLLLALLVAVAVARPTRSGYCGADRKCFTSADCHGTGTTDPARRSDDVIPPLCCNGMCVKNKPKRSLGELCHSPPPSLPSFVAEFQDCFGECDEPGFFACKNGLCEREFATGNTAAGCACSADSWCQSGICIGASGSLSGTCRPGNLPPGASCTHDRQCSSLGSFEAANRTTACVNGVCAGIEPTATSGMHCNANKYDCAQGNACILDPVVGVYNCSAPRAAGEACSFHRECATGLACNSSVCITAFSAPAGMPCSADVECESQHCSSRGVCSLAPNSVPDGQPCLDGDIVCRPGSRCAGLRNPVCQRIAGTPCDVYDWGGASVCSVSGKTAVCRCSGSWGKCVAQQLQYDDLCRKEAFAVARHFGLADASVAPTAVLNTVLAAHAHSFPVAVQTDIAKFVCCVGCLPDDANKDKDSGLYGPVQAYLSYRVRNCASDTPIIEATDATTTNQCTATEIYRENDIVGCPVVPVAGKSTFEKHKGAIIGGSVAGAVVLVAIVAVVVAVVLKGGDKSSARPKPADDPAVDMDAVKPADEIAVDEV